MCSLRLMLGWERLLDADDTALPALRSLCQALNIDTHWDEAERTLYIQSPVAGKRVAVVPVADGSPALEELAGQIAAHTAECLGGAGASVLVVGGGADLRGYSLALRVDVCSLPSWGVAAAYNWLGWSQNRRLATCLAEEVSAAGGLLNLGTRASFNGVRQPGLPVITVLVGRPSATLAARESGPEYARGSSPEYARDVARGIYRGLARFWADPVLEEIQQLLPRVGQEAAEPGVVACEPGPVPAAPVLECEPEPVPEPRPVPAAPVLEPMAGSQPGYADEEPVNPVLVLDPEVVIASEAAAVPAGVNQADFRTILGIAPGHLNAAEPAPIHEPRSEQVPEDGQTPDLAPLAPFDQTRMAPFDRVPDDSPAEPGPPPEPLRLIRPFHSRPAPAKRKALVDPRGLPGSSLVYQFQPPQPAAVSAEPPPSGISPAGLIRQAQARTAQVSPPPDKHLPAHDTRTPGSTTRPPAAYTRSPAPIPKQPARTTVSRVIQPGSTVIRFP
ncbi:MAG TPA: hypothetical protein VGK74_27910 [Symbiobacteriaceae bacterium]|jgi:hypothetical protein